MSPFSCFQARPTEGQLQTFTHFSEMLFLCDTHTQQKARFLPNTNRPCSVPTDVAAAVMILAAVVVLADTAVSAVVAVVTIVLVVVAAAIVVFVVIVVDAVMVLVSAVEAVCTVMFKTVLYHTQI